MFIVAQIFCFGSINLTLTATFDFASVRNSSVTSETNLSSGRDSLFFNKNSRPNHNNLLLAIELGRHSVVAISAKKMKNNANFQVSQPTVNTCSVQR